MNNICISCKKSNLKFLDNYKYEINKDINFLGKMKIYECQDCKLVFTHPMPEINKLEDFYSKVYRSINRPHYYSDFDKKFSYLFEINLEYISYLTANIDFNNIKYILDFGAGLGNIGYALKKKFNHLELFCIESDENCLDTLKERGYKNIKYIEDANCKFDLVISLHVLEHLTNLEILNKIIKFINTDGFFFFEVPNSDFNIGYKERIFDSPHLIFFNINNINTVFQNNGLSKISLLNTSYTIEHDIENQLKSFNMSNKSSIFHKIKYLLKKILPSFIINTKKKFDIYSNILSDEKLKWYFNNLNTGRCLRGIYKR